MYFTLRTVQLKTILIWLYQPCIQNSWDSFTNSKFRTVQLDNLRTAVQTSHSDYSAKTILTEFNQLHIQKSSVQQFWDILCSKRLTLLCSEKWQLTDWLINEVIDDRRRGRGNTDSCRQGAKESKTASSHTTQHWGTQHQDENRHQG